MNSRRHWLIVLLFAVSVCPAAAEAPPPAAADDAAFATMVDIRLLGRAWSELDADLATDVALQLVEAERILGRSHRAATAAEAFDLAVELAISSADGAASARLEKALERFGLTDLLSRLRAARKLGGASRGEIDPAQLVDAAKTSPDAYILFHNCLRDIESARVGRSAATLSAFKEALPLLPLLDDAQRRVLAARLEAPIAEPTGSRIKAGTLMHLSAASRSGEAGPTATYEPPTARVLQRYLDDATPAVDAVKTKSALEKLRVVSRCIIGVDC